MMYSFAFIYLKFLIEGFTMLPGVVPSHEAPRAGKLSHRRFPRESTGTASVPCHSECSPHLEGIIREIGQHYF